MSMSTPALKRAVKGAPVVPTFIDGLREARFLPGHSLPTDGKYSVLVSPALASDWMSRFADPKKRLIRGAKVDSYANDMKAGKWVDHKGSLEFIIDANGDVRLSDGHHRLTSVSRSGKSIRFEVWFGAPEAARMVEGNRIARTAGDTLRMLGCEHYAGDIAASVRLALIRAETVGTDTRWRTASVVIPDNDDIGLSWLEDPDGWHFASNALSRAQRNFPNGVSYKAMRAFAFLAETKHPGRGHLFLDTIAHGGGPKANGRTVNVVLTNLLNLGYSGARSGGTMEWDRLVLEILTRAFNAETAGVMTFSRPRLGSAPFVLSHIR